MWDRHRHHSAETSKRKLVVAGIAGQQPVPQLTVVFVVDTNDQTGTVTIPTCALVYCHLLPVAKLLYD
jgi:hypothetical protein